MVSVSLLPDDVRSKIQSIKNVLRGNRRYSDDQIYSMLEECHMDPDDAVQRLLEQGSEENQVVSDPSRKGDAEVMEVDAASLDQTFDAANIQMNPNVRHTTVSVVEPCVGLIGLTNLGNTCFINSAIHGLIHTPELVTYFHYHFQHENKSQNLLGMKGELALAFEEPVRKLWAEGQGGQAMFSPKAFKVKVNQFAPQFAVDIQHDAQEFLTFWLNQLHEDLNRVRQEPISKSKDDNRPDEQVADEYWENHIYCKDSIIVDLFYGQYKSTLTSPTCNKISVTFDPFVSLTLPLKSATPTLYTCIESFLLPDDALWNCPQCNEKKQVPAKQQDLYNKLETCVDFPLHDFDLTKYIPSKMKNKHNHPYSQAYELYAIVNHYGRSLDSGHYTTYVKLNNGKWYDFNDSCVTVISEDNVKSKYAYLLFYRRVNLSEKSSS